MNKMPFEKYKPFEPIKLKKRQWPDKQIIKAPTWCSVDLRDGNQSLVTPMGMNQKLEMFKLLCDTGFKEIEIGFPSASEVEYDFCRRLIEGNLIPEDVEIQVLVQAREHLIAKTFEALKGVKQAIVHVYNSTSTLQREIVFQKGKAEVKEIAIQGAKLVKEYADKTAGKFRFEYSPESFSQTEMDYALDVCEAVLEVFNATIENPVILNLPGTVESSTPNVHADQIEWFCTNMKNRQHAIISLHTHNDRGTGIAACELGVMAGADRVEGTLFGNGERTGNLDIMTMALNIFSQGVDPELDFSDVNHIKEIYTRCTKMSVHERHPYVGDLVYTAFSGSHQDAINKGMKAWRERKNGTWCVPYLPIDPKDVGRYYESIIRINSQSGKGGVAYIMEAEYGFEMPKNMHTEFGQVVQKLTDRTGIEATPKQIKEEFDNVYLKNQKPFSLTKLSINCDEENTKVIAEIDCDGKNYRLEGNGNGPISAFVHAFNKQFTTSYNIKTYEEHTIGENSNAKAVAYIGIIGGRRFSETFGAALDENISRASIKAFLSAANHLHKFMVES